MMTTTAQMADIEQKINVYRDVIQRTVQHVHHTHAMEIITSAEMVTCVEKLDRINKKLTTPLPVNQAGKVPLDDAIALLQPVTNELSAILQKYGTQHLDDLLVVCVEHYVNRDKDKDKDKDTAEQHQRNKFQLLRKYFHPTGYKVYIKKTYDREHTRSINTSNKDNDNTHQDPAIIDIDVDQPHLTCGDLFFANNKPFAIRVHGIKLYFQCSAKKHLVLYGWVDHDVMLTFLQHEPYVEHHVSRALAQQPHNTPHEDPHGYDLYVSTLTLKDLLVNEGEQDHWQRYLGLRSHATELKLAPTVQTVDRFVAEELPLKRYTLYSLLLQSTPTNPSTGTSLAHLLYDLLSSEPNQQRTLYDSLQWNLKQQFRIAVTKSVQYTHALSFDLNKIPLEQQICLLRVPDAVKEKAMTKLKEVKSKSDDAGAKARQYLDGLLKIPFGVYKREPILQLMPSIRAAYHALVYHTDTDTDTDNDHHPHHHSTTMADMLQSLSRTTTISQRTAALDQLKAALTTGAKTKLLQINRKLTALLKRHHHTVPGTLSQMDRDGLIQRIRNVVELGTHPHNWALLTDTLRGFDETRDMWDAATLRDTENANKTTHLQTQIARVSEHLRDIRHTLDTAVHGHRHAKRQIERIVAQWMNGEPSGYCFGFEGPPGTGKTSLAKRGLAHCLRDAAGTPRPFAMIQMGGDSNGCTLHGHNYTYLSSTWGSIVQILMDAKCMNPIIFIDEVDKISRTEHGRELVGILTHLLDPTQNDSFQDKYFQGIDLDLSKALFVLSYNDPDAIDRVLLDRIHRVRFDHLSLADKLVICHTHLLPDICTKMGLTGTVFFDDTVLTFLIEEYTYESGVRKLKELLFEVIGEINLELLSLSEAATVTEPSASASETFISVSIQDLQTKYLKDKRGITPKRIPLHDTVGVINGLWANALGKGGILPIQVNWRPAQTFLGLHLTGMQGDVMKESMHVALTLAWNLTSRERQLELETSHAKNGVHIHVPEGATPKDGPSAGTAIAIAIYSLFNQRPIRRTVAITGEMSLDGRVTEIGGLDLKCTGAIRAGVTDIVFPTENTEDWHRYLDKEKDTGHDVGTQHPHVQFHSVAHIHEVFPFVFA